MQTIRPRGHAALRRGRLSIPGHSYHVVFSTAGRKPLFRDFWTARAAIAGLLHPPLWRGARACCWVLMPDHFHALLSLGGHSARDLATLVQAMKAVSARCVRRHLGTPCGVWSRGYYERALRSDEGLIEVARYIVGNPVRDGLATHPGDYPHWDAMWLAEPGAVACPD